MFKRQYFQLVSSFIQQHQRGTYPYPSKRILILIATHADTPLRQRTIHQNLTFLRKISKDILIVNTKGTYNISKEDTNLTYLETDNEITYDFGKWTYGLTQTDVSSYDFILFINDSILIHEDISAFVHQGIKESVELYGYTDNHEHRLHYQSYLFMIRIDAIPTFINMVNSKKSLIHCYQDLIQHYEIPMRDYFSSHNCFLPLSTISPCNVYAPKMKALYNLLRKHHVIPFTKLKQILHR
jgi:hypothetical protein